MVSLVISLIEPQHDKTNNTVCPAKTDQTGRLRCALNGFLRADSEDSD